MDGAQYSEQRQKFDAGQIRGAQTHTSPTGLTEVKYRRARAGVKSIA